MSESNPLLINGAFFRLDLLNPSVKYVGGKNKLTCEIDEETFYEFKRANLKGFTVVCKATVVQDGIDPDFEKAVPEKKERTEKDGNQWLSNSIAMVCKNANFWKHLTENSNAVIESEESAIIFVYTACGCQSRSELDFAGEKADLARELLSDYRDWAK